MTRPQLLEQKRARRSAENRRGGTPTHPVPCNEVHLLVLPSCDPHRPVGPDRTAHLENLVEPASGELPKKISAAQRRPSAGRGEKTICWRGPSETKVQARPSSMRSRWNGNRSLLGRWHPPPLAARLPVEATKNGGRSQGGAARAPHPIDGRHGRNAQHRIFGYRSATYPLTWRDPRSDDSLLLQRKVMETTAPPGRCRACFCSTAAAHDSSLLALLFVLFETTGCMDDDDGDDASTGLVTFTCHRWREIAGDSRCLCLRRISRPPLTRLFPLCIVTVTT